MIQAYQLTGIGRFSRESGKSESLINKEEFQRDLGTVKTKDITEICRLTEEMEKLGVTVNQSYSDAEMGEVLSQMIELSQFAKEF